MKVYKSNMFYVVLYKLQMLNIMTLMQHYKHELHHIKERWSTCVEHSGLLSAAFRPSYHTTSRSIV